MSYALHPRFLEVRLYDRLCGYLCEAGGNVRFVPADEFRGDTDRPTLSLSITVPTEAGRRATAEVLDNPFHPAVYNTGHELPPYFAGLLPEGELRKRLEATRSHPEDKDDFGILASAGNDLPGAVVVRPADIGALPAHARAYGVTGGADNLEIAVVEGATQGAASVSGVQNKLALSTVQDGKRYTLPSHGKLSDIIAKLPARNDDAQVFNEAVSMQLAAAAGVHVAATRVLPLSTIAVEGLAEALGEDLHYLAVDRFDRTPAGRVHAEDGCQMLGRMPARKYASIDGYVQLVATLYRLSPGGVEHVRQFFLRQAVNTLIGNSDAHLKNFSVIYPNGVLPVLSPAYDIVCVAALPGFASYGQNVAIDRLQREETLAMYEAIAEQAGVPRRIATAAVREAVALAHARWPRLLDELDAPAAIREVVTGRLATLPLARAARTGR
ncbi:putative regulator; hipA-like domains [Cupriavidus taiwanensis]|uniref:Regulator hipA-like domains n=1 Tax=Cupriavidus taiwanensis TaxID=164546 RepID=A0A375EA08_9BURK|nr:HipA domain-containing protein [Cupriavidus taiwanensis]SOZ63111.1 putative regulator; hipA-like domains [Cupriavidus taiwanensis]SOZ64071.1 putative regulator; hipA-like domains [Cupriavidus taiwanensis]SOZ67835.1 putative regulator; hipA-like domains [Cupriavidus taiwanensis]SPA01273.1 putative regulator; hipA-like domains [Cupriavidus taiwanensis]SPA07751.1 putative regulator; hipA-like domains [Cupriavidus taiwanensis]